jgi:hypothetical protein
MHRLIDEQNYQAFRGVWPERPYWSFLGNHTAMAAWQSVIVPRLYDCFASTTQEWWALTLTSSASAYVGGELARSMAFHAAENSRHFVHTAYAEGCFAYCMSAYDMSFLDSIYQYTKLASTEAEQYAAALAERAFRHGKKELVSAAVDRLAFFHPQSTDFSNPILEYHIALARYDHMCGRTINLRRLFDLIREHGNAHQQRIFLQELSTFVPFNVDVAHTVATIWAEIYGPSQPPVPPDEDKRVVRAAKGPAKQA